MGLTGTVSHTTVWRCDNCKNYEIVSDTRNNSNQDPIGRHAKIWISKPEEWMVIVSADPYQAQKHTILCHECWNEQYFVQQDDEWAERY